MKLAMAALTGLAIVSCAGLAAAAGTSASTNSNGCKVVHLKPGENPPTGMSTSINAGNGQVSGQTTVGGGGGGGVSVSSGSGSSATSGAGAASSSMSTSSNGKTTTVTSSDGNCTVYTRD